MKWVDRTKDKWAHAMALAAVSLTMIPVPAWAQGMNQTQVDTMVQAILNVLTGPIAKGLAAIALARPIHETEVPGLLGGDAFSVM